MIEEKKMRYDYQAQPSQLDALIRFFHQTPDFVLQPLASTMIVFEDHIEIVQDFLTELEQDGPGEDLRKELKESVDRIREVYPIASQAIRGYWQVFNAFYEVYINPDLQGDVDADLLQEAAAKLATELQELRQDQKTLTNKAERLTGWLAETQAKLIEAEKLASVGRLSFGVGHDLRNTLATAINSAIPVKGAFEDLQRVVRMYEEGIPDEEIEKYKTKRRLHSRLERALPVYTTMMDSLNQALGSVKALEGYTVDDGSDFQDMRIESVIQKVLRDHQEDLQGIQVETSFEKRDYVLKGNPLKIYGIFQNLIINAIEATAKRASPTLRITTQISEGEHRTTVEDNGCGMSEEVQRHAFEPFYTTKELAEGRQRGLGLFNVWRLVEQQSGTIKIKSELDEYTRFDVQFEVVT